MDSIEIRRRRATWRACHRGTKEMDVLLGRYAETVLPSLDDPALAEFEQFLALPDPELQKWLLHAVPAETQFSALVVEVRAFHGLG